MTRQEEQKKKIVAAISTAGITGLILLVMMLVISWRAPGLGEGQYPGIEVNLGSDDQGSGDDQPDRPTGTVDATDDENPPVEPEAQQAQETNPAPEETTEDTEAKPTDTETLTDPNSDVVIKEEKKEVKPVEKPVEKKEVEKPVEKKVEEKPKVVDSKAVYKGKTTTTTPTTGTGDGRQGTSGNEGDDEGRVGDKGVEGGTPGANVYKGTPGGGSGGTLDIDGWNWDNIPRPVFPANETTGQIVFEISVNDSGELEGFKKLSGTLSPAAERACVEALRKLTFTKKPGAKVPPTSKGKITFVVTAK